MTRSEEILASLQGRFGTQDPSQLQIQKWQYYDYVRYPVAGTTQLTFFTNPIGATDPVSGLSKTLEQTNLTRNGMFDYPFIITEIKTHIFLLPKARQAAAVSANTSLITGGGATASYGVPNGVWNALWNLSGQGILSVVFGQKTYFDIEQPFRFCPTGFGVDVTNTTAFSAVANVNDNTLFGQSESPEDIYKVTPPVLVEKDQILQININFPQATSTTIPQISATNVNVDLGIIFEGFAILPTQ
ncbi:hypothetical protein EBZ80_07120 [bacterium]|nr:hypothetical protein [bacterium]